MQYGCVGVGQYGLGGYSSPSFSYSSPEYSSCYESYCTGGSFSDYTVTAYNLSEQSQNFEAGLFLNPNRSVQPMIYRSDQVMDMIREAFEKITGTQFPDDGIQIVICDDGRFKSLHSEFGPWHEGIMGFSINKFGRGVSEVFVRQAELDALMLTVGHELGHVLSPTLLNLQDEEAKAHAFSLAWMDTIREHNIGGLRSNIVPNPANNGLHDVAFNFVKKLLHTGASSYDIFKTLSKGLTSIVGGCT